MPSVRSWLPKLSNRLSRKALVGIAVLVLIVLGGIYFLRPRGDNASLTTKAVTTGDITQQISASGTVEPVQMVTLTFKSSGLVNECLVRTGDEVKAGQVLAREAANDLQAQYDIARANLENAQASYNKAVSTRPAKLAQARAQLAQAKSALNTAQQNLDRQQKLFAAGAISRAELDSAQSSYQSALSQYQQAESNLEITENDDDIKIAAAQVKSSQANLQLAQNNMGNASIVAPFDGYIAQINGSTGQWTPGGAPSSNTTESSQFSIILSSRELQLEAQINEADISKIKLGQEVNFTVDTYPDKVFTGKVATIASTATTINNVQMYAATITIDDYSLLKSGMPASANIIIDKARNVMLIPQTALDYARSHMFELLAASSKQRTSNQRQSSGVNRTQGQGGWARNAASSVGNNSAMGQGYGVVVVLDHGREVLTRVKTGLSDDYNVEIKSGLKPGDLVVVGERSPSSNNNQTNQQNSVMSNRSGGRGTGRVIMFGN